MNKNFLSGLKGELDSLRTAGKYKVHRYIEGPMHSRIRIDGREILNLSSNNYLGLANHPEVVRAAQDELARHAVGTASVRFICGSFDAHRRLEKVIADFFRFPAALSYVACWNANTGLIPTIAGPDDVIVADELNHASLIDGVRLANKTPRKIYPHSDMAKLEAALQESAGARRRLIVTDGVFSMEGDIAKLDRIADLAERYDAVVIVDDSHGHGVLGATGRGIIEHYGLDGRIDILTGTLGKALGGAAGGFVAAGGEVIEMLQQASRPQIFSNSLPPMVAGAARRAIELLDENPSLSQTLKEKTVRFRKRLKAAGLKPLDGESAIIPIIIGETKDAIAVSRALFERGIFVTGFGYPVVPEGSARIRIQMSTALTDDDLDRAFTAVVEVVSGRAVTA